MRVTQDIEQVQADLERLYENVPAEVQAENVAKLPTQPGTYLDKEGGEWRLTDTGNWYDSEGVTFDPKYNFVLGVMGIH
jgi:hypothetical protein